MKYKLNLEIEGDQIISGVRINFIGEDGYEVLPEVNPTPRKSKTQKSSPRGDEMIDESISDEVDKSKINKNRSSPVIENKTSDIPPEMDAVF